MKIAYDNSRMEKKWKNNEVSWDDFCKRGEHYSDHNRNGG